MVEQDARTAVHVVGLTVFLHDPETIKFGHGVGTVGVERRILVLRHLLHLAVKLRRAGLIDAAAVAQAKLSDGLQHAEHACRIDIGREFGGIEAHLHLAYHSENTHGVAEVGIMQMEMWPTLKMGNALAEVHRRAAYGAMHAISFFQQKFGQIRAVLSCDARDEGRFFIHRCVCLFSAELFDALLFREFAYK